MNRAIAIHSLSVVGCVLALSTSGAAQTFRVYSLGNGNNAPAACKYDITQSQPRLEERACNGGSGCGPEAWQGSALSDRGLLDASCRADHTSGCTTLTGYASGAQVIAPVVISGPAGAPVPFSFAIDVAQTSAHGNALSGSGAQVSAFFGSGGFNTGFISDPNGSYSATISGVVAVNTPNLLRLTISASCSASHLGTTWATQHTSLSLQRFLPVFTLPAGYTANSPELNIVNNIWLGPELGPVVAASEPVAAACAGNSATLSVSATGPSLHFAWRRNGGALADGATGSGSTISGASTAQLTIVSASAADEAQYDCVVSNACGSVTGTPTALHVAPPIASYCTAGTTTNGCSPAMSASGTPSASATSGFVLQCVSVEGAKSGLFFYGTSGSIVVPWVAGSTSTRCVAAPTQRTTLIASGGTAGACDGVLAFDWSAFVAANPLALGAPFASGDTVWVQAWFRDPPAPNGTNLSDGLQFSLCP